MGISNFNPFKYFCQGHMYLPLQNLCISTTRSLHSLILQKYYKKSMPDSRGGQGDGASACIRGVITYLNLLNFSNDPPCDVP
jgi:hypothetical protein